MGTVMGAGSIYSLWASATVKSYLAPKVDNQYYKALATQWIWSHPGLRSEFQTSQRESQIVSPAKSGGEVGVNLTVFLRTTFYQSPWWQEKLKFMVGSDVDTVTPLVTF